MENVFTNMLYVLFPILIYFLLGAYNKNIDKDNDKLLNMSLLTSLLMVIYFSKDIYGYDYYYLFNIPLLMTYLSKRDLFGILMSLVIVIYLVSCNYNIYLVISNYILVYILYKLVKNKYYIINVVINSIFIILYHDLNIDYLFNIIIYIITNNFVLYLFNYISKIMKFYMTMKEIETNKELQQSLFKISHEIKNPIAVCNGYLELMDGSKDKYDKYIPIIKNEINHSLQILKDFSVIGKLKVNIDIMDIGILLDEVISDYELILDSKQISLDYINDYDELLINGDYIRLKEVFINIIKNSIEALENIKNPYIKIRIICKDNIIIKVIDNGVGSDEVDKISEPFFTTKENGTGLGTYLSREIIGLHKGKIEYKSKINRGMEVIISLDKYIMKKEF